MVYSLEKVQKFLVLHHGENGRILCECADPGIAVAGLPINLRTQNDWKIARILRMSNG